MSTKVITGVVRLSYAHIWEPKANDDGVEKYSVSLIIPKSDKKTLKKLNDAIEEAKDQGKADKWGGKIPANLKLPLRDGDEEREDDPTYAGAYFINATSKTRPGIAKPVGKKPDGSTKLEDITDTTEVYSGCYAKVSVNLYPFNVNGNRGIACGLNNIVKVQDGEFLGGRSSAQDDFANEDFDMDFEMDEDEIF